MTKREDPNNLMGDLGAQNVLTQLRDIAGCLFSVHCGYIVESDGQDGRPRLYRIVCLEGGENKPCVAYTDGMNHCPLLKDERDLVESEASIVEAVRENSGMRL